MATVESYESESRREGIGGGRVGAALALACLVHGGLYLLASQYQFRAFGDRYYEELVPTRFKVQRVEIDPRLLTEEPEARPAARSLNEIIELKAPPESVGAEDAPREIRAAPIESKLQNEVVKGTPETGQVDLRLAMSRIEESARRTLEQDLRALHDELLAKRAEPARGPSMSLAPLVKPGVVASGALAEKIISENYSDLDALLRQGVPLRPGTAPILMPTDLLFDYDRDTLRPDAMRSLSKLADLLKRNPDASFIIEGHTDSFGTDEYNLSLSKRRAEAVGRWLVRSAGIDPRRIATAGLGETRLLISGIGTVEEQQLNRRVEIIIRTPR